VESRTTCGDPTPDRAEKRIVPLRPRPASMAVNGSLREDVALFAARMSRHVAMLLSDVGLDEFANRYADLADQVDRAVGR
jgi:hypothetical protein